MKPITFSRYLALVLGILTPLGETIRRWSTWRENPPALFDDYILGAFLLYGAWRVGKEARSGQRFLAAAWAFMCGMAYYSFFGQLHSLHIGATDPAPISSSWVAVIKGIGLAVGVIALILSLWTLPEPADFKASNEHTSLKI
jgi:hypothetical protein